MLPVTVNGHGLREVLLIYYFKSLHIGLTSRPGAEAQEVVVALSVLLVVNDFLWNLPGGLYYLMRKQRKDRSNRIHITAADRGQLGGPAQ